MQVEIVNLNNGNHVNALLILMNDYMEDKMGLESSLEKDLGDVITSYSIHYTKLYEFERI